MKRAIELQQQSSGNQRLVELVREPFPRAQHSLKFDSPGQQRTQRERLTTSSTATQQPSIPRRYQFHYR
jgi:hypothetical protein